jgi:hypothetical protein
MVSGYAPAPEFAVAALSPRPERRPIGRTQLALLSLIQAVRNLRDEHDVQCLTFLAGELGLLRHTPFCFSRKITRERPSPESLILRDTFSTMLDGGLIGWDGGSLHSLSDVNIEAHEQVTLHSGVSWLGSLSPHERTVLTQATVDLHASGANLLSSEADMPFRRIVARILGNAPGADASERRMCMVRRQLGIA